MKSFLVNAFSLNFVKKLNSFMTEVLSYRNQSHDLKSKSMEWFLYDRHFLYERVEKPEKPNKRQENHKLCIVMKFLSFFHDMTRNKFLAKMLISA